MALKFSDNYNASQFNSEQNYNSQQAIKAPSSPSPSSSGGFWDTAIGFGKSLVESTVAGIGTAEADILHAAGGLLHTYGDLGGEKTDKISILSTKAGNALDAWSSNAQNQFAQMQQNAENNDKVGATIGDIVGKGFTYTAATLAGGPILAASYLTGSSYNILHDSSTNNFQKTGEFISKAINVIPGLSPESDALRTVSPDAAKILGTLGEKTAADFAKPATQNTVKAFLGSWGKDAMKYGTAQYGAQLLQKDQQNSAQGLIQQISWKDYLKTVGETGLFVGAMKGTDAVIKTFGTAQEKKTIDTRALQIQDMVNQNAPYDVANDPTGEKTIESKKNLYTQLATNELTNLSENNQALLAYKVNQLFTGDSQDIKDVAAELTNTNKASKTFFDLGNDTAHVYDAVVEQMRANNHDVILQDQPIKDASGNRVGAKTTYNKKSGKWIITVDRTRPDGQAALFDEIGHAAQHVAGDTLFEKFARVSKEEFDRARSELPGGLEKDKSGRYVMSNKEVHAEIVGKHMRQAYMPADGGKLDPQAFARFERDYPKMATFNQSMLGDVLHIGEVGKKNGLSYAEHVQNITKKATKAGIPVEGQNPQIQLQAQPQEQSPQPQEGTSQPSQPTEQSAQQESQASDSIQNSTPTPTPTQPVAQEQQNMSPARRKFLDSAGSTGEATGRNYQSSPVNTPEGIAKTEEIRSSEEYGTLMDKIGGSLGLGKINIQQLKSDVDGLIANGQISKETYLGNEEIGGNTQLLINPKSQYVLARLISDGIQKATDLASQGNVEEARTEMADVYTLHAMSDIGGSVYGQGQRIRQEGADLIEFSQSKIEDLKRAIDIKPDDPFYADKIGKAVGEDPKAKQIINKIVKPLTSRAYTISGQAAIAKNNIVQGVVDALSAAFTNPRSIPRGIKLAIDNIASIGKDVGEFSSSVKANKLDILPAAARLLYHINDKLLAGPGAAMSAAAEMDYAGNFDEADLAKAVKDRMDKNVGQGKVMGGISQGINKTLQKAADSNVAWGIPGSLFGILTRGARTIVNIAGNDSEYIPVFGAYRMNTVLKDQYGVNWGQAVQQIFHKEPLDITSKSTGEKIDPIMVKRAANRAAQNLVGQAIATSVGGYVLSQFVGSSDNTPGKPTIIGSGPSDQNKWKMLESQGYQRNSIRIPFTDTIISISDTGPLSSMLQAAANASDQKNYGSAGSGSLAVEMSNLAFSLVNNGYLQSLTGSTENPLLAISQAIGGGSASTQKYATSTLATPFTNIVRTITSNEDTITGGTQKTATQTNPTLAGIQQAFINSGWYDNPYLSQVASSLFGGAKDVVGPDGNKIPIIKIPGVSFSYDNENPVYMSMMDVGKTIDLTSYSKLSRSSGKFPYSVPLSTDQQSDYLNLMGQQFQPAVLSLISDPTWSTLTKGEQKTQIDTAESEAKKNAEYQLLSDYPDLVDAVQQAKVSAQDAYYGTGQ